MMLNTPIRLLVVDDDEIDREVVVRAFRRAEIANAITTAVDGREALDILRGASGAEPLEPPYIVLLDWHMPRMNGLEFLTALRADEALRKTVVFVLTTSQSQHDQRAAQDLLVTGYIVKGKAGRDIGDLVELLERYWSVAEIPLAS